MAGTKAGAAKALTTRGGIVDPLQRFNESVHRGGDDDCWEWTRARDHEGYGLFKISSPRRSVRAHRFAWEIANGHSPGNRMVLHSCDNPPCCNPRHLYLGDAKRNAMDRSERLRGKHGEAHHRAKLTAENVREMRRRREAGETIVALGEEFGVNHTQVSMVCRRKNWRHV